MQPIFAWQADGVWIGTQCVRFFFGESARRQALVGVEGRGAPVASISSGIRCSILAPFLYPSDTVYTVI